MPNRLNLAGQKFGLLKVVGFSHVGGANIKSFWRVVCVCGQKRTVRGDHLRAGETISCGCDKLNRIEATRAASIAAGLKHGHSRRSRVSTEYKIWIGIKTRCLVPTNKDFKYYGARGISVCDRWLNSFENFLVDMGNRPKGLTLDRINTYGNYEPGNCRWATWHEQRVNQRKREK